MNKQKLNYLAPEAETLVIRFEENILLSGGKAGASGKAGAAWQSSGEDADYINYGDL